MVKHAFLVEHSWQQSQNTVHTLLLLARPMFGQS
jgi:hypothetical protein